MRKTLIAGAARTPIGALNGSLSGVSAPELGEHCLRASLERAGLTADEVEEVIFGNVLQAGLGQNPARQIGVNVGAPIESPAFTVNQVCGSGMKAVELAFRSVATGEIDVAAAGGTENMSQAPHLLPNIRSGIKFGGGEIIDTLIGDGLTDVFSGLHMGVTAENVAEKYSISREAQDRFAVVSQEKCAKALESGSFKDEIVPITVRQRKGEIVVDTDEHPRPGTTLADLAKLRPAFKKDGSVTPGNASGVNDGAASMLVVAADSDVGKRLDPATTVKIAGTACRGCDPALMGLGPIYAVRELLRKADLTVDQIDVWELNEAFAAQSIAVINELGMDPARVNVNGGAVALGHPIGASGARILVTLIHEMKRRKANYAVASLCVGGGMGLAMLLENS